MSAPFSVVLGGYLDLRWRLNPVEATFHGLPEFDGLFAHYDAESVREQLAALVSYENAIEEADVETLADEIDRTAVLHSLRHDILLLGKERQFVRDPAYHLLHAVNGIFLLLARRPADSSERAVSLLARLDSLPGFLSMLDAAARLHDELGFEPHIAEAEAKRYCAFPTYQLCYAVGRRDILALREDLRKARTDEFTLATFHEELLQYGALPTALARWGMGLAAVE